MTIKLTSTDLVQTFVNALVYGESGVGKTTLCGTAPNPLIISVEGGLLALANKSLPVFEVDTRNDLNEVHEWLKLSKEADKFDTICIDSLSEVAEVLLSEEKLQTKDARQAYGAMADLMAVTVRGFRDFKKHVIFTAKNKKIIEESTGAISYMPSVPGQQFLHGLPYFFDEVFYMDYGKLADGTRYRFLNTVGDRQYIAKDRSGVLLPREKPDLQYIFDKIVPQRNAKVTQIKPTK